MAADQRFDRRIRRVPLAQLERAINEYRLASLAASSLKNGESDFRTGAPKLQRGARKIRNGAKSCGLAPSKQPVREREDKPRMMRAGAQAT